MFRTGSACLEQEVNVDAWMKQRDTIDGKSEQPPLSKHIENEPTRPIFTEPDQIITIYKAWLLQNSVFSLIITPFNSRPAECSQSCKRRLQAGTKFCRQERVRKEKKKKIKGRKEKVRKEKERGKKKREERKRKKKAKINQPETSLTQLVKKLE